MFILSYGEYYQAHEANIYKALTHFLLWLIYGFIDLLALNGGLGFLVEMTLEEHGRDRYPTDLPYH